VTAWVLVAAQQRPAAAAQQRVVVAQPKPGVEWRRTVAQRAAAETLHLGAAQDRPARALPSSAVAERHRPPAPRWAAAEGVAARSVEEEQEHQPHGQAAPAPSSVAGRAPRVPPEVEGQREARPPEAEGLRGPEARSREAAVEE
jgi:hypothetical protein